MTSNHIYTHDTAAKKWVASEYYYYTIIELDDQAVQVGKENIQKKCGAFI